MLQSTASTINYLLLMGVAHTRNKLALRTKLRNLNLKSHLYSSYSFRDHGVHMNKRTRLDRLG